MFTKAQPVWHQPLRRSSTYRNALHLSLVKVTTVESSMEEPLSRSAGSTSPMPETISHDLILRILEAIHKTSHPVDTDLFIILPSLRMYLPDVTERLASNRRCSKHILLGRMTNKVKAAPSTRLLIDKPVLL